MVELGLPPPGLQLVAVREAGRAGASYQWVNPSQLLGQMGQVFTAAGLYQVSSSS